MRYATATSGVNVDLRISVAQATGGSGADFLSNIENLVGSNFADVLRGSAVSNVLSGGAGSDALLAFGGADILTGGAGADDFYFNSLLGGGNVDTITDFSTLDDIIYLENTGIFSSLAAGTLAAGAFNLGTTATQLDDRIIYNSANGAVYYDADGVGGVAAVQFATVKPTVGTLSNLDFWVY